VDTNLLICVAVAANMTDFDKSSLKMQTGGQFDDENNKSSRK